MLNFQVKFTKIVDLTDSSNNKSANDQHSHTVTGTSLNLCYYTRNSFVIIELCNRYIILFIINSDCGNNVKLHQIHVHNDNVSNNNNNTSNLNNNQKLERQYTINEDGPTISEDQLDNLINQSINEWQQRQKNNDDAERVTIDIDLAQPASFIS